MIDITKEIINLSGKEIRLLDQDKNEYKGTEDIEQLKQHLKNIVHKINCQHQIENLNINQEELNQIENVLNSLDKDKNGSLTVRDLSNMFSILNMNIDQTKFFSIYENADKNKDGIIDRQEFILLMKNNLFGNNQNSSENLNEDDDNTIFG